jgi:hypothetical protein
MKQKLIIFLVFLLLVSVFVNVRFLVGRSNFVHKKSVPYLLKGEKLGELNLIDLKGQIFINTFLEDKDITLLYIFSRPCSICNKNINQWNKIVKILKGQINVLGIISDSSSEDLEPFRNENRFGYKIYTTVDSTKFKNDFRIILPYAQTLIFKNNVLKKTYIGELSGEQTIQIIEYIKAFKNKRSLYEK